MNFKPYLNQNYQEIKQERLQAGKLFKDKLFPASDSSVYKFNNKQDFVWKRPHDIIENPQFIVNNIVPNDLDQGQIGDCWLISSCAAVATVPEYIDIVIPKDQTFDKSNYAGIFHFRLWRFGEWIDVVVDDFLPVNPETNELIYCHNSKDPNEMFGPLLEKAFAKLNTCYEFLDGGDAVDAMIDMTGGIGESFKTKDNKESDGQIEVAKNELWDIMFKSFELKSLCGASIEVNDGKIEEIKKNGLVLGHAYGIEKVFEMYSSNSGAYDTLRNSYKESSSPNSLKLLRMRNPWGQDDSWKGNWCKTSNSWSNVSDELKQALQFDQLEEQFYISLADFCANFDVVQFVHVNMNAFYEKSNAEGDNSSYKFQLKQFEGEWVPGKNSGGCGNGDFMAYWLNPQYNLTLNLENNIDDKVTIIVSLIQTDQARKRAETDGTYKNSNEAIYFAIYKVKNPNDTMKAASKKYGFKDLEEVGNSETYLYQRETCKRFELTPGDYIIIPSTFDRDVSMKFLLRVFVESTMSDIQATELSKNVKKKPAKIMQEVPIEQNIQEQPEQIESNNQVNSETNENQEEGEEGEEEEEEEEEEETEPQEQDSAIDLSYHTKTFELPVFDEHLISVNVSKACSIM